MKRFITVCVLLLSFTFLKAQTFTVTDIQWGANVSDYKIKKNEPKILGATANLEFYDNAVRITLTANEEEKKRIKMLSCLRRNQIIFIK